MRTRTPSSPALHPARPAADRSPKAASSALLAGVLLLSVGCDDDRGSAAPAPAVLPGAADSGVTGPIDDERLEVGRTLLADGRLVEAGMIFDTVVSEHPEMARANFFKGLVLHQGKSHASAISWYEAAASSDQVFPERSTLAYYLGWCRYYSGDIPAARLDVESYLATDPDRSDAHFLAGIIALDEERLDDARASLERAIALADTDEEAQRSMARAWIRLADVYVREQAYDSALASVDRALELRPRISQGWFRKYTILVRLGREEDADFARKRWKDLSSTDGESLATDP